MDLSFHDNGGQACLELATEGGATLHEEAAAVSLLANRIAEEIELGVGSIGPGFGVNSDLA